VTNSAQDQFGLGYRVIRALAGEPDSPWPGSLVSGPEGQMYVVVDAEMLGAEWPGWSAAADGHVLAPSDILRRPDGHDALLPVCTERVEDFLARRGTGGADLSPGEGVTLAVSLLRGVGELQADEGAHGSWWLTDGGRPVFAIGCGDSPAEGATAELLADVARDVPVLAEALADVLGAVSEPRRLRSELERTEERLFAVAEPVALATTTFGPRRARSIPVREGESIDSAEAEAAVPAWQFSLARHVDADWADLLSRMTTGLWRTLRARRTGRRRPWLLAAGFGCAIVVAGLLWPTAPSGPATADPSSERTVQVPNPSPSEGPVSASASDSVDDPAGQSAVPPPAESDELTSVADRLLTDRIACGADPECLRTVLEAPGTPIPPGVVDLPAGQRSVTLLDEFGGAAVLRAEAAGAAPQLVVLVHTEGRWLLRDVHDVAQQ
jgi:hypothetical protein